MSLEDPHIPPQAPFATAEPQEPRPAAPGWTWLALIVGGAGLACSVLLWQKVNGMQEQLARQTAEANTQAVEARALARQSQDLVRDAAARLSVVEARVGEVSLQRSQLEELMQNLSRSRDDTLVVDIESTIRLAQQQVQLTGSAEPLVAALKTAARRIDRAAQPRLTPVQLAMEADLERLSQAAVTDTASLLARLDDLVLMVDDLPLLNSVAKPQAQRHAQRRYPAEVVDPNSTAPATGITEWAWWEHWGNRGWLAVREEARDLLRVSRIDHPDAILMAPEQAFFLRENLKLKLLNARLALLARQIEAARTDLQSAQQAMGKYFDGNSRRIHTAQALLTQIQSHLRTAQQPALDDTLSALATAAAGR